MSVFCLKASNARSISCQTLATRIPNDPRRAIPRDPVGPGPSRYNVNDDANRGGMWAWIVGIIAVIVIAMLVYDYNRPISTAVNPAGESAEHDRCGTACTAFDCARAEFACASAGFACARAEITLR